MIQRDMLVKTRIEQLYGPVQILRFCVVGGLYAAGVIVFPADFILLTENAPILFFLYGIGFLAHLVATLVFRRAIRAAEFAKNVNRIQRAEGTYSYVTTLAFALLIPAVHRYYGNFLWFISAFLFSLLLANPFISRRMKLVAVLSPIGGFLFHALIAYLRYDMHLHPPGLLFAVLVCGLLWYLDGMFERTNIFAALSRDDANAIEKFSRHHDLSSREREVLEHLLRGQGLKTIGTQLFVSQNTIKTHTRNIYRKTGTHSRTELLVAYTQFQLKDSDFGPAQT